MLLDTPYLRRVRQQGKAEGLAEGGNEGVIEGLREAILEAITLRFNPTALEYRRVEQQLEALTHREALQRLHAAIQAEDMATFVSRLAEEPDDEATQIGRGQGNRSPKV